MAQSIGSIYVDLQANTGTFVSELSKAAAAAQRAARDISGDFKRLGDVASQTFGAFGNFNPIISKLSFALESAGNAASGAMKSLSGLGGVLGPLAALGAGASAGLIAVSIGAMGMAASSAESADKLKHLSQTTGVSVETLSRFGYVAKQTGVDSQAMTTGLERLSRTAYAAAVAPAGAANAFTRLGISVRDTSGQIRPTQDLLLDLADKFSQMPDGIVKTAMAMQIFGRGGAQMIPMLDQGRAALQQLADQADKFGVTISGSTAEAAHEFSMTLGRLSAIGTGLANRLMEDLLPALDRLADSLGKALADRSSSLNALIDGIANLTKNFMNLVSAVVFAGRATASFWELTSGWGPLSPTKNLKFVADLTREFKDMQNSNAFAPPEKKASDQSQKAGSFMLPPGAAPAPTASREPDIIAKMVETLKAQAAAELAAAAATEKGAAAALLSKAATEAETKIAEQRAGLLEREKMLRGELADARAQEAAGVGSASATGTGGPGVRALQLEAEISGIQKMRAELEKSAPLIRQLYAEISSGEFAVKAGKDLADLAEKTDAETAASTRMAAAYRQGGQAIVDASADLKLASFEKTRADIAELIAGLEKLGVAADTIAPLRTAFDQLGEGIARAGAAERALNLAKLSEEIGSQTNALRGEAEAYRVTGAAALASAAAQREAAARAETVKFAAAHPEAAGGLTPAEVAAAPSAKLPPLLGEVYSNAIEKENQQYEAAVRQQAAQLDLNKSYDDELAKLKDAKAFLESSGASAIAIDTKIYELKISHIEQIQRATFEAQNQELLGAKKLDDLAQQLTTEWDKAALAVGSIADKFRAMANEIELAGEKLGENVFNSLSKAVEGISSQLAHFIVTGKSSFKQFFEGIAEELLKAQMQWSFAKILEQITGPPKPGAPGAGAPGAPGATPPFAGHVPGPLAAITGMLGIKSPSAEARRPLGTATDPIHVIAASTAAALGAGSPGGGSSTSPFYSIIADSSGNPFDTANPLPMAPPSAGILTSLTGLTPPSSAGESSSAGGSGSGFFSQIGGMFSKIFGSLSGALSGIFGGISSFMGGAGGGLLSGVMGIGKIFAGFLATGGDAEHGHAYIVGEKGPELFRPAVSGTIIPSFSLMKPPQENDALSSVGQAFGGFRAAGGEVSPGMTYMVGEKRPEVFMPPSPPSGRGARNATVYFNVNGASDADSFRRSQSQIFANLHAQMELAMTRG